MIRSVSLRLLRSRWICASVVVTVLVLTALAVPAALRVNQDDDLLAFLPADNPEVVQFRDISRRFGSLDVGIIGIATDDPFAPEFVEKLGTLTRKLNTEADIAFAMSLNNVEDFEADAKGGISTRYLMREPPANAEEKQALRELVMSKRHVVGNLIAPDGKSVNIYAFLAPGTNPRTSAALVRKHVAETLPNAKVYWGGAPFISTYIYDVTQADMRRLIPWAVGLIILIIVASFRDVLGALLSLGSTGIGILFTYGLMGARGVNANLVLSAMPVILFAVGSAYSIHVMVRYYTLRRSLEPDEAMAETLAQIGPTVLAAGLTTVAGLMSFLAMDIQPMRQFGLYTGLGIFATLVLSLTFVPAVVVSLGVKARSFDASLYERAVGWLVEGSQRHRKLIVGGIAVVLAGGGALASRVEARMENAAFFAEGSPPAEAEAFMRDHFGGSLFLQVMVEGDMNDPAVLRELEHLADRIGALPHVTSVNHIAVVLSLANEALAGERRLPTSIGQVRFIYRYLAGLPAVDQLLHPDREAALIHARIDTDEHGAVDVLLSEIEALAGGGAVTAYRVVGRPPAAAIAEADVADVAAMPIGDADRAALDAHTHERVTARIATLLREVGENVPHDKLRAAVAAPSPAADATAVAQRMETYLTSNESLLDDKDHALARELATAYAALDLKADTTTLRKVTRAIMAPAPTLSEECERVAAARREQAPSSDDDDDDDDDDAASDKEDPCILLLEAHEARLVDADAVADVVETPLAEARRRASALAATQTLLKDVGVTLPEAQAEVTRTLVAGALMEREPSSGLIPGGELSLGYQVSGVPVLYRGLSRSVTSNQFRSLGMALGLVLLIMIVLFRSPVSGALAAAPTVITLVAIYGLMGAMELHLDIGTSMLASIIIGAGVDYAVHLMAAWRGDDVARAGRHAAQHAGPAIATNALMVAAGFFVLTLGDAKPLQNVGRLTATAMLVAALATFLAVPALSRRTAYGVNAKSPRP